MANISNVEGDFVFDFGKCKKVSRKQIKKITKLFTHKMDLGIIREDEECDFRSISEVNVVGKAAKRHFIYEVLFQAEGKWSFDNNLSWIMSESRHKERKVLRKFKGLNVTIRWKEYEPYYEETITGTYLLCVGSNQIKVKSQTIGRPSSTRENGSYFLNTSMLKINCDE